MSLLVIGHSFVHQLDVDSISANELRASVSSTFCDVTMEGIGGGTVECLRGMLPFAERASMSVILIDIGMNKLSSPAFIPRSLACQIGELARQFRQLPSVNTVVVMPILPRIWWSPVSTRRDKTSTMRVLS